jgi:uncharacterized membrane protein
MAGYCEKHNCGMIIVMVIAILVGFVSMVTSAMAASDVSSAQDNLDGAKNNDDLNEAHKTATISAVLQGIVILCLFIALMLYIFRKEASSAVQTGLTGLQGQLGDVHQWVGTQQFGQ